MPALLKPAAPGEVAAAVLAAAIAAVVFVVCFMALALYHAHRPGAFAGETFVGALPQRLPQV